MIQIIPCARMEHQKLKPSNRLVLCTTFLQQLNRVWTGNLGWWCGIPEAPKKIRHTSDGYLMLWLQTYVKGHLTKQKRGNPAKALDSDSARHSLWLPLEAISCTGGQSYIPLAKNDPRRDMIIWLKKSEISPTATTTRHDLGSPRTPQPLKCISAIMWP